MKYLNAFDSQDVHTVDLLKKRLLIERKKFDRSGIYGYTQRTLAYNSNRIEGSTLTPEQTTALFEEGYLPQSDSVYRTKDIEEMTGHFLMFNKMLDTLDEILSEEIIKTLHFELKSGVFEDRANGYAIGDYKQRRNMIGGEPTVEPDCVHAEMCKLLDWYANSEITLSAIAEFHAKYEIIHPFQDGNGRTGRMIVFRECLKHNIVPVIILDDNRPEYLSALKDYRRSGNSAPLTDLFLQSQEFYLQKCKYFLG